MRVNTKNIGKQIAFTCAVILFIAAALILFINGNNKRIAKQNESYIADATEQSARRAEELIESAYNSIYIAATLYSDSFETPDSVDQELLDSISEHSLVDYVEFIAAGNTEHTFSNGITADISDREYYVDGMNGNSGVCYIPESRFSDGTLFVFYAPMYYQSKIIGVLCGVYTESSMREILSGEFFGTRAKTYLCAQDGSILVSSETSNSSNNIITALSEYADINQDVVSDISEAFAKHEAYVATYRTDHGTGNAYFAPLSHENWMLMQTFPSSVAERMMENANTLGVFLAGCVILAFVSYIIFLLVLKRRQAKELMNENLEIMQIIQSISQLFVRFVIIDLEQDTYSYIGKSDDFPSSGKYSDLMQYTGQFYVDEEDKISMKEVVTPEYIQTHMTRDIPYLQYEYHIHRNQDRWENASIICLKRENGKPVSVLYAIQDVTDLKRAEIQSRIALKNAFDAAEAANRAKSEFLSRMSHDIRTPMNAVMGMTAVAAMHLDDKERLLDCLNKITTSSRHLLALINDVLDMSKIESGKVTLSEEPFNLAEMTESLITIMHPQIKAKDQKMSMRTFNIQHEDVIGDTLRLRQVFVNIMGNAVKFTPEGGSISLDIREVESHINGKACYEFIFTDTGIGMEQEFIDTIFDPFTRSKSSVSNKIEGTGLGMSIARNIVRMMNGNIKVESQLGVGSKFTVQIYLTIQDTNFASTEALTNLKILVADDDEGAAASTSEILQGIGMDASWVLSGDEAIARVTEQHERGEDFGAVILDWKMPEKTGVEAAKEIREKVGAALPIIILSAYDWTDIEQEAKAVGVNAFIAKPLFRSRLIYVLKSLVEPAKETKTSELSQFKENSSYDGKRILLVEDNEINREVAKELLEMIGVEVEMAFDGQLAIDTLLEKPEGYYDLIFMDIQMPNKNGYEATKEIRASDRPDLKRIPIVAMSADAFSDDIYRAHEAGMNDHVAKPIEISKLSEALEKWLK